MTQYNVKKGLKIFGEAGADAVVTEMKRRGRIKDGGYADGRKNRAYITKDATAHRKVVTGDIPGAFNMTEHRKVVTGDIPGAFMQTDIDEVLHVHLEGPLAKLLTKAILNLKT